MLIAACTGQSGPAVPGSPRTRALPPTPPEAVGNRITEAWETRPSPGDELDSLAFWQGPAGERWIVATARATDRLAVYDAETGELLRHVGGTGSAPGQFDLPNGIVATRDLLFVVERDNRRVQVLRLPEFTPIGSFGSRELRRPYGIALLEHKDRAAGRYEVWITDDYSLSASELAPPDEFAGRIRHFEVVVAGDMLVSGLMGSVGATEGPGTVAKVESILADTEAGRVLVADSAAGSYKVYDLEGHFTGQAMTGPFGADPEGLALYRCLDGGGYWLVTEQQEGRTRFHLLDRETLAPVGAFTGDTTANTEGIALTQERLPRFPQGAVFAVHGDRSVSAFDWATIAQALDLRTDCAG